ncbi:biotin/lipoyl-containing protein, partial [Lysobacter sp.]|uniref:biotin/lipoyl-containing protein n=1 Tax=Lysobacter sp. TaxID=72226 RepID=UPI002D2D44C9
MTNKKTFLLPDLGEGLPDATIVEWFVKEGDTIRLDENLVSMETAKAVVEVPSPVSGKVLKLAGGPGDVIVTGKMLAEFEIDPSLPQRAEGQDTGHHHGAGSHAPDDGDKVIASDEGGTISDAGEPAPQGEPRADSGTVVGAMQSSDAVRSEQAVAVGGVKAMPAVRAMARKLGVDIARVRRASESRRPCTGGASRPDRWRPPGTATARRRAPRSPRRTGRSRRRAAP